MGNICSSLITPSDMKINMSKPLLTHNNELPQGQNNNLIPKSTCSCHIKSKKRLQPGKRKKPIGNSLKRKNKAVRKKVKKLEQEQLDEEDLCCCSTQSLPITEVVSNEEYEEYSDQFIKQGKRKRQCKMSKKAKKRTVKKNKVCQRLCCRCKAANCSITEKLFSSQKSKKTKKAKKYKKAGNNTCRNSTDNCLPAEELTVEQDHLNDHRSKQEKGEECCQLGGMLRQTTKPKKVVVV
ncbi:uncharacterized protein LOC119668958 isoform X2 [Teleopsis dalmanni]|uniref:uncharacterized protein LOC119664218 isoform X2 n=1 Tax=Teleopsis dalmanni TaxID=139649 RepID=UPI0018CCAEBE|nr:uncharacterized protein LOC119664218 isoform X2 [Teleopsis dalmanni]XP_037934585.1 uncharacterized protein LOC119668958 isoform X2 [Teleopsis dalmanni]